MYVAVGTALALRLWRERGSAASVAAPGLIAVAVVGSFAALDFWLTRTVGYVSTIFGFLVVVGWTYAAWAVGILGAALGRPGEARDAGDGGGEDGHGGGDDAKEQADQWNHVGSLLATMALLWGYLEFMQFLIAWMGNKLPESRWYVLRGFGGVVGTGWDWAALALFVLGFAVPFGAMLFRTVKRRPGRLAAVAGVAVAGRLVDAAWLAGPSDVPGGFGGWSVAVAVAVTAGFGLLWWPVWSGLRAVTPAVDVGHEGEGRVARHVAATS